jgi:N6-L-threonylcarbamoyladenine synthase
MLVLGIETSCDETASAIVEDGWRVRSSVVDSQHALHAEYRGVVPEIASRAHAEAIAPVVRKALEQAGLGCEEMARGAIGLVAVTHRPGLIGPLLVGVAAAKALAWSLGAAIVGVDHVHAHLHAALLRDGEEPAREAYERVFPAIGLVVSGGHSAIYRCESPTAINRLGSTIDDALGEAYDKVAAMLGLAHPGGPVVDAIAQTPGADESAFDFPVSRLSPTSLDLSFSGLKTAVLYALRGVPGEHRRDPSLGRGLDASDPTQRANLCASFQRAAIEAVVLKLGRALDQERGQAQEGCVRSIIAGGGVVANSRLRSALAELATKRGVGLHIPPMRYCLDNAAMIAGLGHEWYQAGRVDDLSLAAEPTGSR